MATTSRAEALRARRARERQRGSSRGVDGRPRTGTKRTVLSHIKRFPAYLKLLFGLITDGRVALADKLLVGGAIAYIVMPVDMIPDFIPFLGEVDDLYLLVLALRRLIAHAGERVLLSHWSGDPDDLTDLNLRRVLAAAAFFLPKRIRNRLRSKEGG